MPLPVLEAMSSSLFAPIPLNSPATGSAIEREGSSKVSLPAPERANHRSVVTLGQKADFNFSTYNSQDPNVPPSIMFSKHNASHGTKLDQLGFNPYMKTKWCMMCVIGIACGFVAWILLACIAVGSEFQQDQIQIYLDEDNLSGAWGIQLGFKLIFALIAALLVAYWPPSGGSGIPDVMGYLNGVDLKEIISIRTFFIKLFSCMAVNLSGLPVGPEGPIIHLGAMCGGGISQGHSRSGALRITLIILSLPSGRQVLLSRLRSGPAFASLITAASSLPRELRPGLARRSSRLWEG